MKMVCKPVNVDALIGSSITDKEIKDLVGDAMTNEGYVPFTDMDDVNTWDFGMYRFWSISINGKKVFVDTQDYDYARYMAYIVE